MGLDMYFYASRYESSVSWKEDTNVVNYPQDLKMLEDYISKRNFKSTSSNYQIGYFRKFNALHNYIVEEYADGEDRCQRIYLSQEDIEKTLELLKSLNKENCSDLLPTSDGFFFGSTEYDDWYWKDVEEAIKFFTMMKDLLDKHPQYDIFYQASW